MSPTTQHPNAPPRLAESLAVVRFRGDPDRLASLLLPPPLEPVDDGRTAFATVADAVPVNDPPVSIDTAGVRRATVGMPCQCEGDRYAVEPLVVVDRPTRRFRDGFVRGVGTVTKTKWHASCAGRRDVGAGDTVAGDVLHGGNELFSVAMELGEEVAADAVDGWPHPLVGYRHVSDPLAGAADGSLANDLAVMDRKSLTVGTLRRGTASLAFGGWRDGLLTDLADAVTGGFHVTMAYDDAGERPLAPAGDWGEHLE